jgi:hypothetical protein
VPVATSCLAFVVALGFQWKRIETDKEKKEKSDKDPEKGQTKVPSA